jgi:hypothetical protein
VRESTQGFHYVDVFHISIFIEITVRSQAVESLFVD